MAVRHYKRRGASAAEVNDLSANVTWANVPDANITQSSVTQHEAALTISEAQVETALSAATAFTANNYVFNVDQAVGVGTDNYVLTYDNGTGEIGLEAAGGGVSAFNDLSDVTITAAGTGEYIRYSGSAWVDSALDISDDTSPTLGGDLATGSNSISGAGTIDVAPNARSITATTTTATTDYSKVIRMTSGSGQELTLDSDPPTNAVILVDNSSGNSWTIACATAANLIWAKDGTTGDRTLADDGLAVCLHRGSGVWIINGSDKLT
jgi:hypothetical protein